MAQVERAQQEEGAVLSLPQLPSSFWIFSVYCHSSCSIYPNAPLMRRSGQGTSIWMERNRSGLTLGVKDCEPLLVLPEPGPARCRVGCPAGMPLRAVALGDLAREHKQ